MTKALGVEKCVCFPTSLFLPYFTDFMLSSATTPFSQGFYSLGNSSHQAMGRSSGPCRNSFRAENRKHNNWADNMVPPIFHPALKSFLLDYSALIKRFVRVHHSSLKFLAQKPGTRAKIKVIRSDEQIVGTPYWNADSKESQEAKSTRGLLNSGYGKSWYFWHRILSGLKTCHHQGKGQTEISS